MSDAHPTMRKGRSSSHPVGSSRGRPDMSLARMVANSILLSLILFTNLFNGWFASASVAHAAALSTPSRATMTLKQFLQQGNASQKAHGPAQPSASQRRHVTVDLKTANATKPLPSAQPATMQPLSTSLTTSFLATPSTTAHTALNSQPLDLKGSDGRFEFLLPADSLDLSQATSNGKKFDPTTNTLTLKITQLHGYLVGTSVQLGAYQFQVLDRQGHVVSGVRLRQPATIIYHYQPGELEALNLDPGEIHLSWPTLLAQAHAANKPTTGLEVPMSNDAKTHTLSAHISMLVSSAATTGGDPTVLPPPTPHLASVSGNSGQLSYSYPLQIPSGAAGFVPNLQLSYSSESTNENYDARTPASAVGEGWSIGLGSITSEKYPDSSAGGKKTWYSLSNIDGVSDRLISGSDDNTYETQHISHLKIKYTNDCFHIWDTSGNYYELGCTDDSHQYTTNSNGDKTYYRWDLNRMVAPFESTKQVKTILISYLQDKHDKNGHTTIRDAAIKQIKYGVASSLSATSLSLTAGTIDFHYRAPSDNGQWASSYGKNHSCASNPPDDTTLRCDDPITRDGNDPPDVMSTLTLDKITSYIGTDSNDGKSSFKAYSYAFSYQDYPFRKYTDPINQNDEYAAGDHLLMKVTPTIYQHGTAIARQPLVLQYTADTLLNTYYDGDNNFSAKTKWHYLTSYLDLQTGIGGTVAYQTAYPNTHGTPNASDGDNRYDPLYCGTHNGDCSGNYNHPDEYAWTTQVVTSLTSIGKDSSDSNLPYATTYYGYDLAVTGSNCPKAGSNSDCVGDTWTPSDGGNKDDDWKDYYHSEFRGFAAVYITSPSGNLTVNHYYSTKGRFTKAVSSVNYNTGQLYEEDSYQGNQESDSALLKQTVNTYAGQGPHNACRSDLDQIFGACEVVLVESKTTTYDGTGTSNTNAPWVQTDYTYDDYDPNGGLTNQSSAYHNLTQEVISSSNAPTLTRKWQYAITNETDNNVTYYHVNLVSHSEIDDSSGHVWMCQKTFYDEGRPGGVPAPAAGWATSNFNYTDCSNQAQTTLTSYSGYDLYGNTVATVDNFGAANSSIYASGKGCSLSTAPAYMSGSWTASSYTACMVYDQYEANPTVVQNALAQATGITYDYAQGGLTTSKTDLNGQATSISYSYDSNGYRTIQSVLPGATASYTKQSKESSTCTTSSTLPCYEIDSIQYTYANAIKRTFYDAQGRAVETRTPLDSTHDTITFTVYNESTNSTFQSQPFRVASGSGWLDPNGATDDSGNVPGGTVTTKDALGRTISVTDPLGHQARTIYGLGTVSGDNNTYEVATSIDANNHVQATYTDALDTDKEASPDRKDTPSNEKTPRVLYTLAYSGTYGGTLTANTEVATQYNALNKPTSVTVTDLAPQSGQNITSVTTTATYDDMGRMTSLNDPDRGTHTYTYDPNGNQLTDVSGTHTIGTSYDLLGRAICIQDAAPTTDGTGNCSSGSHPLVQNTYDVSKLGVAGNTDFPLGLLTQSIATTYYSDGSSTITTEQFQHDQRGRAVTSTIQVGVPGSWNVSTALPTYQMTQAYNDADQKTTTQTSAGGQTGYTFSQAYDSTTGALIGLSNNSTGVANLASLSFNASSLVSDINFQTVSGTALANEHLSYDGDQRPTGANVTWQSGSGSSGTVFSTSRNYDPAGNVASSSLVQSAVAGLTNSGGSETQNFCYDEQSRLVWAGNGGTQPGAGSGTCGSATLGNSLNGAGYNNNYAYTHLGQIWQAPLNGTGSSQQYLYCNSNQPHQLTGVYPLGTTCSTTAGATAAYSASYDNWGNMTSRIVGTTSATLSYDILNHLTQWNSTDSSNAANTRQEEYAYDASGNRVLLRDISGGKTSLTTYAFGLEEHTYDATGNNNSNTYYYSLNGRLIGQSDGTNTQFDLTDELGSVLADFNDLAGSAIVLANQAYGPYGNKLYSAGTMGTNKGFTGQYSDPTSLDYYGARYYDPLIGLFISADIVQGNVQGADPFAYVNGNPETNNDPTGQSSSPSVKQVLQALSNVAGLTGKLLWEAIDLVFNFSGMMRDVQTITDPKASGWSKAGAAFDLGSTVFNDVNMLDGEGEAARAAEVGAQIAEKGVADAAEVAGQDAAKTVAQDATSVVDSACGALSFSWSTAVATVSGEHAIGSLKPGDKVWAYNPTTKKMELQPILHVWINHDNDLVDLTLTAQGPAKKAYATSETLHTNKRHPFLTTEKGFVPVGQLKLGMHVIESSGLTGIVMGLKSVPGTQTMYNLEVAQDHTFTVGVGQWVVHNCTLTNLSTTASPDEIDAANYVASIKNEPGDTVTLRDPSGERSTFGATSDLVVNGVNYDIYTPETNSVKQVLSGGAGKFTQGNGVVLNLSKTSLTSADLGNALGRMRGLITSWGKDPATLRDVIIYDPKVP